MSKYRDTIGGEGGARGEPFGSLAPTTTTTARPLLQLQRHQRHHHHHHHQWFGVWIYLVCLTSPLWCGVVRIWLCLGCGVGVV